MGFLEKEKKKEVKPEPIVTTEPSEVVEESNEIEEKETTEESIEETKEVKKEEEKYRFVVVKELPTQVVRSTVAEDGTILNFITVEEALTEAINK